MDNNDNSNVIKPLSTGLIDVSITKEMRNSFLDYSMSVIVSRALPDVRDGLKPVHRRIIYAMNDLGMSYNKPYKKAARIVGDVIGKYHPHGDVAVYDALVRLAQDFSTRYPLIDGHGNFGSLDGDAPAAMRYTEARLARISNDLVSDLNKNTVDFVPNYDGEELEPSVLPARFPNLLVNGATGIAVGMATNIPPHNLGEVVSGILALIENPEIDSKELMLNYIPGPDFPTGGIILGREGIKRAYETGNGSIIVRSQYILEPFNNRQRIVITEIPYQVNKENLVKRIKDLGNEKQVEGMAEIRDESNRDGIRIVIELKKDGNADVLLNRLFKLSQLQVSFSMNMLALVKGEPRVMGMKEMLVHYLEHQVDVIERRSRYDLNKALDREHIVLGLKIATDHVDEVYQIIRNSEDNDDAQAKLMATFELSERQAKVILDMPLKRLTKLERHKIEEELNQLRETIAYLNNVLADKQLVLGIIKTDLEDIRQHFSDPRRSVISNESFDIEDEDLIPVEEILITLTKGGYAKRIGLDTYRSQNRGGRGVKGMTTHEDDFVEKMMYTSTHADILFFSNFGKVYKLRGHQIPEQSRQGKGFPVVNLIELSEDEKVVTILSVKEYNENATLLFVSSNGIVKRTNLAEFQSINRKGKIAFGLKEGDQLFDVRLTDGNSQLVLASSNGLAVRIDESAIRSMGRSATGVKGIRISEGERVVGVGTSQEGSNILVISQNGIGKMSDIEDYRQTNRNAKGVRTIKITAKTGPLACLKIVNGNEDIIVTTSKGIVIRTSLAQLRIMGRSTQGVKIINLDEGHVVAGVEVVSPYVNNEDADALPVTPLPDQTGMEEVSSDEEVEEVEEVEVDEVTEDNKE